MQPYFHGHFGKQIKFGYKKRGEGGGHGHFGNEIKFSYKKKRCVLLILKFLGIGHERIFNTYISTVKDFMAPQILF